MSGLDFSKVDDKPLVDRTNKSYSDNLDDKFAPRRGAAKKDAAPENSETAIRKTKQKVKGWSLTKDQEVEYLQEYDGHDIVRTVSYLHPRIQMEQHLKEGGVVSVEYLLDGQYPLREETEKVVSKKKKGLENLYLYDGDILVFKRHYYLNGLYKEEFSADADCPLVREEYAHKNYDGIDVRHFNSRGELAVQSGKKRSLKYKAVQVNFYAPREMNDVLNEVAEEKGFNSKSQMINLMLCGKLDPETQELLKRRLKEENITDLLEDN